MTLLQPGRQPCGFHLIAVLAAAGLVLACSPMARADDAAPARPSSEAAADALWAVHGQATVVEQATIAFPSPYRGAESLDPATRGRETVDATLYLGFRPWRGAELWVDPEIDQGFGLNDTLGAAGFPSGEAYKVGKKDPYLRLQRAFLRQTIDLGGPAEKVEADANQFAGSRTGDRLVLTVGKFSVGDVFDANRYAHDPRGDFLNWTVIDTGTFDYAADAWGYTVGAAAEWYQGPWTLRAGAFDLSIVPNSEHLDGRFGQFQLIGEAERRWTLRGQDGKLALTGFLTRGRMGRYGDAIALGLSTGQPPSTALVRDYRSRGGLGLNLEQALGGDIGLFARAGFAGGEAEAYEFTDVDRTFALGLSFGGRRWGRDGDMVGLAGVVNGISRVHTQYLADGGLGILVGDGRLPHPGDEAIVETYYDAGLTPWLALTLDAQLIVNPAYNTDRGPAPVLAARLHAHF
ncbi:carbohydrate porin [Phenylobacterium montanum]|uniref:Carbohydrate porin n=1 Tax=Phenylobacterium montanum TaxID=2823693 RepID=A0A975FWA3_9CAUL|nr:carbohydrate porin [Caulobacter sp. S6]QUD86570.1 carbohydrate porin [Caulobacter sp. S6]